MTGGGKYDLAGEKKLPIIIDLFFNIISCLLFCLFFSTFHVSTCGVISQKEAITNHLIHQSFNVYILYNIYI